MKRGLRLWAASGGDTGEEEKRAVGAFFSNIEPDHGELKLKPSGPIRPY